MRQKIGCINQALRDYFDCFLLYQSQASLST